MRRWIIAVCILCSPGMNLAGQDRVITTPRLATTSQSRSLAPHNAPATSDNAPTRVATRNSFPSLSPASDDPLVEESDTSSNAFFGPAVTATSSLAVVLGLFAGLVWITRKFGTGSIVGGALPAEVLQTLGSTAIDPRTRVTMLRCGNRILVVAQTQTGVQPLSEITDPEEVRRLTAACSADSKQSFSSTIHSLEAEPTEPGFVGGASDSPQPRRRLFASV